MTTFLLALTMLAPGSGPADDAPRAEVTSPARLDGPWKGTWQSPGLTGPATAHKSIIRVNKRGYILELRFTPVRGKPGIIQMKHRGETIEGIYCLETNRLVISIALWGGPPPRDFKVAPDRIVLTLRPATWGKRP